MATSKKHILISACLLGDAVRYNGTDLLINHPLLETWQKQGRLIPLCPEIAGGMSTPRASAEITNGDGASVLAGKALVVDSQKVDVTEMFMLGAKSTLKHALDNHCIVAILTEGSPSCGSKKIYDGSFTGVKKAGLGVTATLLEDNGIKVFNQHSLEALEDFLESLS